MKEKANSKPVVEKSLLSPKKNAKKDGMNRANIITTIEKTIQKANNEKISIEKRLSTEKVTPEKPLAYVNDEKKPTEKKKQIIEMPTSTLLSVTAAAAPKKRRRRPVQTTNIAAQNVDLALVKVSLSLMSIT